MESKILAQIGNKLEVQLAVTYCNNFTIMKSPEYVIRDVAVFQVQHIITFTDSYTNSFHEFILVRFSKQRTDDDITYTIKLTSRQLEIIDKCFTSDDGTWHLIFETENYPSRWTSKYDVSVHMDVALSTNSFASLYDDTELTDFELRGGDGSVRMHRAVLAAASPVLRRMLGGAWRETTEGHVDVPTISHVTLQHLKNYVYLHMLPDSGLEKLLLLSSYYMMPELKQKCVDKLVQSLCAETACHLIGFAATHKETQLMLAILECVQSGAVNVNDMWDHHAQELQLQKDLEAPQ